MYRAILSQTYENAPTVEVVGKQSKNTSVSWKRNAPGIYQGDLSGFPKGDVIKSIDPSSNVDHEIRIYVDDDVVQIYTREWSNDLQEWVFSDNVLVNTSLELKFFK